MVSTASSTNSKRSTTWRELALKVQRAAASLGMDVEIRSVDNPRTEQEDHFYEPDHQQPA